MLQEWKRPRVTTNLDYTPAQIDQESVPAFFIIKEVSWPTRASELELCERECEKLAHGDSTHQYQYESEKLAHNLRVRNKNEPPAFEPLLGMEDDDRHGAAADLVEIDMANYRRRGRLSQHERILKSLICPKALGTEFEIDDKALQGIFYATNEIFFGGSLKGRVTWTWEDLSSNLIGTTAWRKAPNGSGYETLILLSKQILKDKKYNRRLLISTFIHELIHSYLFVYDGNQPDGYQPDDCGGHTSGFKRIAKLINNWVGEENLLQLHKMEAELSDFEIRTTDTSSRDHVSSGCQVQWLRNGTLGYIILQPRLRLLDPDPARG
ncbi:hypothetical protein HD806DRAFT_521680 [Xylariaceae sp. AK1471]|nr:hypothetical protein HD806DRAFT_521680 [Xylariaceae sp. AK1471]